MTDIHIPLPWESRVPPVSAVGRAPRALALVRQVAQRHGVSIAELTGPSRVAHIVAARNEAMHALRHGTKLSLSAIGRVLGERHHTTVLHGVRQHQAALDGDGELDA